MLWIFGDSFSANHIKTDINYVNYKKYTPNSLEDWLKKKLDIDVKNLASCGFNNNSIFQSICENCEYINENDILIIGWSSTHRFRMASNDDKWQNITNNQHNIDVPNLSRKTIEQIFYNRTFFVYEQEVISWTNLILKAFPTQKIVFWRWDMFNHKDYERIREETKFKIDDFHYSENGLSDLSEDIIDALNNNKISFLYDKPIKSKTILI